MERLVIFIMSQFWPPYWSTNILILNWNFRHLAWLRQYQTGKFGLLNQCNYWAKMGTLLKKIESGVFNIVIHSSILTKRFIYYRKSVFWAQCTALYTLLLLNDYVLYLDLYRCCSSGRGWASCPRWCRRPTRGWRSSWQHWARPPRTPRLQPTSRS